MDLAAELKKVRLFAEMDDEHVGKLARVSREHSLNHGDSLFKQGETGDELYVIVMGTIRVEKQTGSGSAEEIATLGSGSYLGEIALVTGDHTRIASARALEKTFVIGLRQQDVEQLCAADPKLGLALYRSFARGLARRVDLFAGEAAHYRALALQHD